MILAGNFRCTPALLLVIHMTCVNLHDWPPDHAERTYARAMPWRQCIYRSVAILRHANTTNSAYIMDLLTTVVYYSPGPGQV